jgi:membrane fusion protein (multidrug efflux system)
MTSYPVKFLFFLLMGSAALYGCMGKKEETTQTKGKMNMLQAEGYLAVPGSFLTKYYASGSLLPNEEIEIHPEISGRVTNISFKEGSSVRKGQTLVQLYDAEIRAQIQKLRSQKQLQENNLSRQKQLLDIGGISRQEYETTQTLLRSADADIAFAEAQLRATRIVAPFDGTIGIRSISIGAVVSPTTVIATLQQTHQLKMDFSIPDQYRKSIAVGKEVWFTSNTVNDTLSGKVIAIDPGADPATRTVKVRAIVPNSSGKLVAGSFAQVIVPISGDNNAILVPTQAVIPTSRDKKLAVVRGGKVEMIVVRLGERTSDRVEILNGLNPHDTVIITGLMQAKPGMEVKITKLRP